MRELVRKANEGRVAPRGAAVFELQRGQELRISDPSGGQSASLWAFAAGRPQESLSPAWSFHHAGRVGLSQGDVIYSNEGKPLLSIVEDDAGCHDFLLPFVPQDERGDEQDVLIELHRRLAEFGVVAAPLPPPLNIFARVRISPAGELQVSGAAAEPEESITLRAERDLVVALVVPNPAIIAPAAALPIDFATFDIA